MRRGRRVCVVLGLLLGGITTIMAESWTVNAHRLPRYGLWQVEFSPELRFENPFDTAANRIEITIRRPSGRTDRVWAFWFQEYRSQLEGGTERLIPIGEPYFRARYTPVEVGEHAFTLAEVLGSESRPLGNGSFTVLESPFPGFIRLSEDPRYFRRDDGSPYFAVGHNVCWTDAAGTHRYREYFDKMAAHGENYTRIWMISWNVELEWTGADYPPLGQYHLGNAWKLDRIFDLAAERGIAIMLCLESFNKLRIRPPYAFYQENPYAVENGGFLESPEQFFTDPRARELYRRKLSYLVSRYAWRTNLLAWEFWNEVDIVERYISEDVVAWHQEMGRYLRELDPYDHPITTSYANPRGDDAVWALPEIEITQTHQYHAPDIAESVRNFTLEKLERFGKPHLFGEFGVDSTGPHPQRDPNGIGLHNGLWASALSGGAGTAMLWWWDNYIEPQNLYWHFVAIARFVRGVPWHRLGLRPLSYQAPEETPARVIGLQNDRLALIWIQNPHHTWSRAERGEPIEPTLPFTLSLLGLEPGSYRAELWDTWDGTVSNRWEVATTEAGLSLQIPSVERDVALKVLPVERPEE
ncbi:MAG: hypothetical protein KatS3mg115_1501 [Candidatus Poribacteria bacterium]|nr:MAG: hypothetical protein KatS3mg115_1501 [Candidatus Poribacteria bacterium]